MPTDVPAEVYTAARQTFNDVAAATARTLEVRAQGGSYTLRFGPIVDEVVDLVWAWARKKESGS